MRPGAAKRLPARPGHFSVVETEMTKREVGFLALRLLGIAVVVYAFSQLPQLLVLSGAALALAQAGNAAMATGIAFLGPVPFVMQIVIGFYLVFRGDNVIDWAFRELRDELGSQGETCPPAGGPAASSKDVQAVAYSVMGVAVLVYAVAQLAYVMASVLAGAPGQSLRNALPSIAETAALFLLGIGLFFGARVLANWTYKLRKDGTSGSPQ